MAERMAKWIGIILGLAVAVTSLVYLPMKANYEECGTVFLCSADLNCENQP